MASIADLEIEDLAPDTYTIVVEDNNGAETTCTVVITQEELECILENEIPASCDYEYPCPKGMLVGAPCDDNDPLTSDDRINEDCDCVGTPDNDGSCTVCIQVDDDDDDAEERESNGDMDLSSSDLEMVMDGSDKQIIGMRFNNLNIPQGATIQSAFIQFTADQTDNMNICSLNIYGEDADNASAFNSNDYNITSRDKTTAFEPWSPANWLNEGDAGPDQETSDISAVIQEIVNRAGFTTSSSIVIIIEGECNRTAVSYDEDEDEAPILCVTFEANCQGGNDDEDDDDDYEGGSFDLTVDCGVAPFSYTVTNTSDEVVKSGTEDELSDLEIDDLAPGSYTIVVTDDSGNSTECKTTILRDDDCEDDGDRKAGQAPKTETNVELRPNPTEYQDVKILIDIKGKQPHNKHTILVSNISGKVIINERLELKEGLNTYVIPNELLMNGMYFVRIQNQQGDVFVLRFVKVDEG